jgi:DNA-binding NarL/FixJ family response regulator
VNWRQSGSEQFIKNGIVVMVITDINDNRIFTSNPSFTLTPEIVEFTKPLKSINLEYFTFDRHHADNSRTVLTNSIDWIKHYWIEKLYEKAVFERDTAKFCNGYVFWEWLNREPVYSEAALYGIDHGITIFNRHDRHYDFFHFAPKNNQLASNEHILQNLHVIYRFISIFKHRMQDAIHKAERHRIHLSVSNTSSTAISRENLLDYSLINPELNPLFEGKDTERIYLESGDKNSWLTKREFELIRLLTDGCLLSDISNKLEITEDTINKRIKTIKNKLNCKTLCEVGFVVGKLVASHAYPPLIKNQK